MVAKGERRNCWDITAMQLFIAIVANIAAFIVMMPRVSCNS
jgi:hypothetical protein